MATRFLLVALTLVSIGLIDEAEAQTSRRERSSRASRSGSSSSSLRGPVTCDRIPLEALLRTHSHADTALSALRSTHDQWNRYAGEARRHQQACQSSQNEAVCTNAREYLQAFDYWTADDGRRQRQYSRMMEEYQASVQEVRALRDHPEAHRVYEASQRLLQKGRALQSFIDREFPRGQTPVRLTVATVRSALSNASNQVEQDVVRPLRGCEVPSSTGEGSVVLGTQSPSGAERAR